MTKLNPIITSLLETDAYKINMACGIFHQFNSYKTRWAFKCRNADVMFTKDMVDEIVELLNYFIENGTLPPDEISGEED